MGRRKIDLFCSSNRGLLLYLLVNYTLFYSQISQPMYLLFSCIVAPKIIVL